MTQDTHETLPWWRVGTMWLVVAGPVAVVLAGIVTTVIAASGADAQVPSDRSTASTGVAELPAMQGRNHAATAK